MHVAKIDLSEFDAAEVICRRDLNAFGIELKKRELASFGLTPTDELAQLYWDAECGRSPQLAEIADKGPDLQAKKVAFLQSAHTLTREQIEKLIKSDIRLLDDPEVQEKLSERLVGGARPENAIASPQGAKYTTYRDSAGRSLDIIR